MGGPARAGSDSRAYGKPSEGLVGTRCGNHLSSMDRYDSVFSNGNVYKV